MIGVTIRMIGKIMRADDLKFEELFHFKNESLKMFGRPLIVHDLYALGQLQRDLIQMLGIDETRRIMTRFGYFWGQADASSMQRSFTWDSQIEALKSSCKLSTLQGIGKTELTIHEFDEIKEKYFFEILCDDSSIADIHTMEMGRSDQSVCWLLIGYFSGYSSLTLGKSVYFIEQECIAKGDSCCRTVGKDLDSWDDEINLNLEYFHISDIHGKIQKLSDVIIEMEEKLSLQQKLVENAIIGSSLGNVEIKSLQFKQIMDLANKVAKFDSSVLITGETGVGKDLLARHIHTFSPRANRPFVAVNCAALSVTLLESELFGHKAGAFTGATRDKQGLFEEANTGIIFLDEIGDISQNMQSKLLRVLQEREIMRVGDTKPIKVDFRLISATNKDLEREVSEGRFREDLFYRLQVIHIVMPPLRERREDILPIVRHFVEKCSERFGIQGLTLDATCIDYLISYNWPGNIREMENAIEHAVILCHDNTILPEHLPLKITKKVEEQELRGKTQLSLEEVEMEYIHKVLELTNGNREDAAKILKIGVATLYRRLANKK